MKNKTPICTIDDLQDPGSFGFEVNINGEVVKGFVVKSGGAYFVYRNSCPHTGAPLDWVEHQFLDLDGDLIQCAVHDARFEIDSGVCVGGPCVGGKLEPLGFSNIDGLLFLT